MYKLLSEPRVLARVESDAIRATIRPMAWRSIYWITAMLAIAAGCTDRVVIPPDAPPEIALPPLAQGGDPDAQVSLGYMYQNGQSFAQSYSQAAHWYRSAADQGNALAQFALGELYARGLGLEQDYRAAVYWFERAALSGNVSAQYQLAHAYENGLGLPRDYSAAALWYGRASQGSRGQGTTPPAIERLSGRAYENAPLVQPPRLIPLSPPPPAQITGAEPNQDDHIVLPAPEPPPPGEVWVHVASFRTSGAAASQWETLKSRHTILLGGLTAELASIDLGGDMGIWVRVQAGPLADMTVAQSLCAALHAQNVYCAPVRR